MRSDLAHALKHDFPEILGGMAGLSVPDHWEPVLRKGCQAIMTRKANEEANGNPYEVPKAVEVKEKYGSLRFYVHGLRPRDAYTEAIIDLMESIASAFVRPPPPYMYAYDPLRPGPSNGWYAVPSMPVRVNWKGPVPDTIALPYHEELRGQTNPLCPQCDSSSVAKLGQLSDPNLGADLIGPLQIYECHAGGCCYGWTRPS